MASHRERLGALLMCVVLVVACGTYVSPTSGPADLGVAYPFELGHCGIKSPIDFDQSMWTVESDGLPDTVYQPLRGTMTLLAPSVAEFAAEGQDDVVHLTRRNGPQLVPDCA